MRPSEAPEAKLLREWRENRFTLRFRLHRDHARSEAISLEGGN